MLRSRSRYSLCCLVLALGLAATVLTPLLAQAPTEAEQLMARVEALRNNDPDAALALLDEAMESRTLADAKAPAPLYRLRAEIRRGLGHYDRALTDAQIYVDLLAEEPDPVIRAGGLFLKGTIAAERNEFATALEHFHEARSLLEQAPPGEELARVYNAIGVTHNFGMDYERARPYYERAVDLARREDNPALQATTLINLAGTVAALEDPDEAIRLYEAARAIGLRIDDRGIVGLSMANLCDLQVQTRRHDDALKTCPEALAEIRPSGQPRLLSGLTMTIGDLYRDLGQSDRALGYFEESLSLATGQVAHVEIQVLERLAELHEERGEIELGFGYLRRLLALREELVERERQDLVEELETRFQLQEKQRALDLLQLQSELQASQLRQRNIWLWALGGGLALVTALTLVIMRSHQRQATLEHTLSDRNKALEAAVEEVGRLAAHDTLTGLLNRRAFSLAAEREIANARLSGQPLAIALGDIDCFKELNDSHGHPVGDQVLKVIAERLQQSVRGHDLVCRWGGEEFLCLFTGIDQEQAEQAVERIRKTIFTRPIQTSSGPLSVSITFGVAAIGLDLEQTILAADRALYRGKQGGRNQVVGATADDFRRQTLKN